jgi:glyoxylase-like metal-dependent hydrolase (beta-lactamase superfamily II)
MTYHVFVSEIRPIVTEDLPPDTKQRTWSPIAATLISGRRDAVLVDPLMTIEDGRALADWVAGTGKNLTTIYATHGHGDHFFGTGIVRQRFPDARFVADAGRHSKDAATNRARSRRIVLEGAVSRSDPG